MWMWKSSAHFTHMFCPRICGKLWDSQCSRWEIEMSTYSFTGHNWCMHCHSLDQHSGINCNSNLLCVVSCVRHFTAKIFISWQMEGCCILLKIEMFWFVHNWLKPKLRSVPFTSLPGYNHHSWLGVENQLFYHSNSKVTIYSYTYTVSLWLSFFCSVGYCASF